MIHNWWSDRDEKFRPGEYPGAKKRYHQGFEVLSMVSIGVAAVPFSIDFLYKCPVGNTIAGIAALSALVVVSRFLVVSEAHYSASPEIECMVSPQPGGPPAPVLWGRI